MSDITFEVEMRTPSKPGKIKAFADVRLKFPDGGTITVHGVSVIRADGKPPFVALPSKSGNRPGKYFPVVEAEGSIRARMFKSVLDAYASMSDGQ